MSTFLFVHGSWHGGWCWKNIIPLLTKKGHEAIAFDLPGHGDDKTPLEKVTFEKYIEKTVQEIDKTGEQVVLVGHSMGGSVISQVAECRPERIAKLVYVAGFLMKSGQSVAGSDTPMPFDAGNPYFSAPVFTSGEPGFDLMQPENTICFSSLSWDMQVQYAQEHKIGIDISPDGVRSFMCNMAPQNEFDYAVRHIRTQALASEIVPLKISDEKYGSVPRYYVQTLCDKCINPALQNKMLKDMPCERVFPIMADHDAFFSAPEKLAGIFLELA